MPWSRYVCLLSVLVVLLGSASTGNETIDSEYWLTGPYTFENLAVFIVCSPDRIDAEVLLTLDEAIEREYVIVHEIGDVGELEVENVSEHPVFIQCGDIVKGGRQDRVLRYDIVVAGQSGRQPLASFCVEQGRWTKRGDELETLFESSSKRVAHRDIKLAIKAAESQSEVWDKVADMEDKLSLHVRGGRAGDLFSPSSLPLMLENDQIQQLTDKYVGSVVEQIGTQKDGVGLISVINGQINCADIYRSSSLFDRQFSKLIEAAAAEAIAEKREGGIVPMVGQEAVRKWLDQADSGELRSEEIGENMILKKRETDKAVSFETFDNKQSSDWIHKNVISK
jgi:hypothetical protein